MEKLAITQKAHNKPCLFDDVHHVFVDNHVPPRAETKCECGMVSYGELDTIITLPDGWNGHTEQFHSIPFEVKGTTAKLNCATKGKEYIIRWIDLADLKLAIQKASEVASIIDRNIR